jgi:hypothetical protein
MHVHSDVPLVAQPRLASMDAHPHRDPERLHHRLSGPGGTQGTPRRGKGEQKPVSLRVNLGATLTLNRLAQRTAVLAEHLPVPVAQLLEQARRPLDVREQQGHRPRRQVASHDASLRPGGWNAHQRQQAGLGSQPVDIAAAPAFTMATYVHLLPDDLGDAAFLDALTASGSHHGAARSESLIRSNRA